MTTIRSLPDEIVLMIMEDDYFYIDDLLELQYVSPAWYHLFHHQTLEYIKLKSAKQAVSFIAAIDSNPNHLYLKSVKQIIIDEWKVDDQDPNTLFDKDMFNKLFFRFPNLELVKIQDAAAIVQSFDDEICQKFQESNSKIDVFEVCFVNNKPEPDTYSELMYKVRDLVTEIQAELLDDVASYGGLIQYLNDFPRLSIIASPHQSWNTFKLWFPILESLPNLKEIDVVSIVDDEDAFMETYISSKSEQEQELLLKSLSTIEALCWKSTRHFCLNAMLFIARYMTGLEYMEIDTKFVDRWNSPQQRLFCSTALGFFNSTDECKMSIQMHTLTLREYMSTIVNTILQQKDSTSKNESIRRLAIEIKTSEDNDSVLVKATGVENVRSVKINVNNTGDLVPDMLESVNSLNAVELFRLKFSERQTAYRTDNNFFDKLIKQMPSLKHVEFDIPKIVIQRRIPLDQITFTSHPQVKDLALRTAYNFNFQWLLNQYTDIFPNLERLCLFYNAGLWRQRLGHFQLEIPNYTLEKLVLDLTHVMKLTRYRIANSTGNAFCVLEVFTLQNGKRYLYKIPFNNINSATAINDTHLEGLEHGEDYYRVYIIVASLKKLELCIYLGGKEDYMDGTSEIEMYEGTFYDHIKQWCFANSAFQYITFELA